MADRSTFNGASTEVPWQNTGTVPEGFGDQYARHITTLYDASALPLTSVGGTGDNVTATVDPSLPPGGLRDGMKFGITWAATNSGPMTLTITGTGAAPVLSADGAVAAPGLAILGGRALLEYVGGAFRVLSGGAGSGGAARYYWQFTASGTWTKPAGLPDDTIVTVELWGGGGGAHASGAGAGGGGYMRYHFRAADLPSSVPIAIGAGGAVDGNGGNTTFGALGIAYGGGRSRSGGKGGGGGGELQAGAEGTSSASTGTGGSIGGGDGGAIGSTNNPGGDARTIYGGGGGGGSATGAGFIAGRGGNALYGGGGGAGGGGGYAPGVSRFGGNGGDVGQVGNAPGGGGGRGAAGARGEVRIWI